MSILIHILILEASSVASSRIYTSIICGKDLIAKKL